MKIAISSTGDKLSDEVDPRFGRSKCFLIIDSESKNVSAIDNGENVNRSGGAGIQAAELISSSGAEVVLTNHCGPKAFTTLQAAGLKVYTGVKGSVADAIDQFKSGSLKLLEAPDVNSHW